MDGLTQLVHLVMLRTLVAERDTIESRAALWVKVKKRVELGASSPPSSSCSRFCSRRVRRRGDGTLTGLPFYCSTTSTSLSLRSTPSLPRCPVLHLAHFSSSSLLGLHLNSTSLSTRIFGTRCKRRRSWIMPHELHVAFLSSSRWLREGVHEAGSGTMGIVPLSRGRMGRRSIRGQQ